MNCILGHKIRKKAYFTICECVQYITENITNFRHEVMAKNHITFCLNTFPQYWNPLRDKNKIFSTILLKKLLKNSSCNNTDVILEKHCHISQFYLGFFYSPETVNSQDWWWQFNVPAHKIRTEATQTTHWSFFVCKERYIEHRAGKAIRLACWRKMTQPGEFC